MATILIEGFDRYGPNHQATAATAALLAQGGWSFNEGGIIVGPSLNGLSGSSIWLGEAVSPLYQFLGRGLQGNFPTVIGGCRVQFNGSHYFAIQFRDTFHVQCQIALTYETGNIQFLAGDGAFDWAPQSATVMASPGASIPINSSHMIEWVINFGPSASYAVWLDGVQVIFGVGQTAQTPNNYCNWMNFMSPGSPLGTFPGTHSAVDDLYLFDTTTAYNNAPLLSNPIVFTDWPIADHQTQFTNSGNVLGNYFSIDPAQWWNYDIWWTNYTIGPNQIYLIPVKPSANCTMQSVVLGPARLYTGSTAANFMGVVYTDVGGIPGTLLSSGVQVTGWAPAVPVVCPLSSPQPLVAGTQYWIGFITDSAIPVQQYTAADINHNNGNVILFNGAIAANLYTSGAPGTAPTMTFGQTGVAMYASCTGSAVNWVTENVNPAIGNPSSVQSSVTGTEDLYRYPGLIPAVTTVHTVAVCGNAYLSGPGNRTIDFNALSAGTDGIGSPANINLTTSPTWCEGYFDVDPHTGLPWLATAVSNGFFGMKVSS